MDLNSSAMACAIANVNNHLHMLSQESHVPLGHLYSKTYHTAEVRKNLALYRLAKKFQVPSAGTDLTEKSIKAVLTYDSKGITSFEPVRMKMDSDVRRLLFTARNILHENFSNFRPGNSAVVLPTGETDLPAKGDCSPYAKLRDPKQWRVTPDCFELAAGLIYGTRGLKSSARKHFLPYTKAENRLLWDSLGDRFEVFKCKLLDFMTIVQGSRLSTVPKNNDEERVINCEPFFNMVVQLNISQKIINLLMKAPFYYTKEKAQRIHGNMISDLNKCTIDLSKASDSNWLAVIKWLYPKKFVRYLEQARSPCSKYGGVWHDLNMLSPMGNGFTFEVMTLTLLTLARVVDSTSSVYGDDIIIDKSKASVYLRTLAVLGYQVNSKKTFLDGYFRESCGSFYHKDTYLTSFDFHYCNDIMDAVIAVNKLIILRDVLPYRQELITLIKSFPPILLMEGDLKTYHMNNYTLDSNVKVPLDLFNVKRFKRTAESWTGRINRFKKKFHAEISSWQLDHRKVDFVINLRKVSEDYVSLGKWKNLPRHNIRNMHLINAYLYAGMCEAPVYRNKTRLKSDLIVY